MTEHDNKQDPVIIRPPVRHDPSNAEYSNCYRFENAGWIVEFYPTSRSYFMSDGTVSPAIDIVELKIKEGDQHGETPICLSIQIDFDYKDFKFVIDRMLNGKTCITPTKE